MRRVGVVDAKTVALDCSEPDELARSLRRADDFIRLAVSAAWSVLDGVEREPLRTGIYVGTAFGPLETNFSSLATLLDDGEGQISPTLFSHSVFNVAAGYVARLFSILGPCLTITGYGWPFVAALTEAREAVAAGVVDLAVVVAAEVYSDLLRDAYCREFGVEHAPLSPGAAAWLLSAAGGVELAGVEVEDTPCPPALCLTRSDETFSGPGLEPVRQRHPMAHVEAMTRAVLAVKTPCRWEISASFGRAEIVFG